MHKKHILKNGLRVILIPMEGTESVTVKMNVKVGSRDEKNPEDFGIAHFIEHLIGFKATKKRPTGLEFSRALDGIGAPHNAYTSKDHTSYYIRSSASKLELVLEILGDIFENSLFSEEDIEKERKIITEEIKMYEDSPEDHVGEIYEDLIYKGHYLGHNIAGTRDSVNKMNRKQILDFFSKYYVPENMVLVISGKIEDSVLGLCEKYFGGLISQENSNHFDSFSLSQKEISIVSEDRKTEQVQLVLGWHSFSLKDKELYTQRLLSVALGGNMSSRLFVEIREKLGLCYSIYAGHVAYEDTGNFYIRIGLDKDNIEDCLKSISGILKDIKESGLTEEELKRTKDFLEGRFALRSESSYAQAMVLGDQELLSNKIETSEEQLQKLKAVSSEEVQNVSKIIFEKNKTNIALIGKDLDLEKIKSSVLL